MRPFDRVTVEKVTKLYGATRALSGVTHTFEASTVTTLEGANGAGKSTLLSLLATLAKPTTGTVRFGELTVEDDLREIRPEIGLVAHEALVYPDLTVRESLELYGKLYRVNDVAAAVLSAMERSALTKLSERTARTLSRGQLQRLSLARATLHDPTLLLFDEPTTGLDAASTERVAVAIEAAKREAKVVIVVTHDRALAERVGDVRVHLAQGKVREVTRR